MFNFINTFLWFVQNSSGCAAAHLQSVKCVSKVVTTPESKIRRPPFFPPSGFKALMDNLQTMTTM